jgi:predicted secreted Zn-dependent protease
MTVTMGQAAWSTYDVSGATLADIVSALEGSDEAGSTDWHGSTYTSHHGEDGQVTSVDVQVQITVSMPHWVERAQAPHAEQVEWDRFVAALHAHEQGHIDLVHTYLEHVDGHMVHMDEAAAAQVWADTFTNLQAASDQYDAANGHGTNAGTTITVP